MSSSKKIHCDTFFLSQPMFLILVGWKPCLGPTHINKYSIMCWDVLPPDEEFSLLLIFHKYSQILANIRSCAEMFSHQTKSLAWCCFFRELSYKLQTPSVWSNNENFLNRSRTFLVVLFLLFDSSSPQQTLTRCWRNVLFFPQTYFRFLQNWSFSISLIKNQSVLFFPQTYFRFLIF